MRERFHCLCFEARFTEVIGQIGARLANFRHVCRALTTMEGVRLVLAIVLALGNYLNGGNRDRGQADGFGLDILPRLKDVKAKDNQVGHVHVTTKPCHFSWFTLICFSLSFFCTCS